MAPDGVNSCPERQDADIAAGALVEYTESLEEDDASAESGDKLLIYDEVENFYLQSGAAAVSVMQLPMCIEDEVVSAGAGLGEIHLVGQSVSESRELRVLAEKWKLDLRLNFPPTFLVKTASGWIRAQKPKVVYRRIMSDGLTLAHFLHYVRKNPSGSAGAMREHLANEFRQFGEKPSLDKLSDFFPVIRRHVNGDMRTENSTILQEFFPGHFSDVVASCTAREICRAQQLPSNCRTIDLSQETTEEAKDHTKRGSVKSTTSKNQKATKAQRARVQTELRNLHSQWCSLLGGRATVKGDKKLPVSNKSGPSESQNPASRKSARPNPISKKSGSHTPLSKKAGSQNNLSKTGRPSSNPKSPPSKRRRTTGSETPLLRKGFTRIPSLESKTSTSDQREKSKPMAKLPNAQKSEEKTMNLKRKMMAMKPASESGNCSSRDVGPVGVHSPSKDLFDRLEDPPICTICDDGGDLICCEGPCQRHFHASRGTDTNCETLGLTEEQVKRLDKYYCKNCLLQQHQCFICQKLGSSAPSSGGHQEVYICDAPGCRKFYHAGCVTKVLDPEEDWTAMAERIERGLHGFLCPRHSCAVCLSKEIQPGAFVQCRRCPKAWHRDCLTDFSFSGELPTTSIWKHYDREFVYCKQHKILPHIQAPKQDHLRFPKE